jgi:hypothetical protein
MFNANVALQIARPYCGFDSVAEIVMNLLPIFWPVALAFGIHHLLEYRPKLLCGFIDGGESGLGIVLDRDATWSVGRNICLARSGDVQWRKSISWTARTRGILRTRLPVVGRIRDDP